MVASTPNECVSEIGDEKVLSVMAKNLQRVDIHKNLICSMYYLYYLNL